MLFDPIQYRTLEERARMEGRPIGAVVREAVEKYVIRPRDEERRKALRWLATQEMDIESDWETVKEDIIQARIEAIEKSLETD